MLLNILKARFSLPTNNKKNKMKKVLVLLVGSVTALSAMSQTTPPKKVAEKDLRTEVKAIKDERAERNINLAHGNFKAAKHDQKEIKKRRKRIHANKKFLKNEGVKEPVQKAKDEVKGN
jgi:hypothetical protein